MNNININQTPSFSKRLPFPLESVEQDLVKSYDALQDIHNKLTHCKQYNGVSSDEPRKKHIDKMLYKSSTLLNLLKALAKDLDEMYL